MLVLGQPPSNFPLVPHQTYVVGVLGFFMVFSMTAVFFICNNISSHILNNNGATQKIQTAITQQKINWQEVIALASGWLVLPVLYDNLEKLQLWDDIPEDIYLYLKTVHKLSEERAEKTREDIKKIYTCLAEKNIPAVAIKGAAYHVNALYAGVTFRIESDIDLLIPDNFLTLSYLLLKKKGFSSLSEYEEQWDNSPVSHHLPPLLDSSGTEVEIHQALYPKRLLPLLTSAEVWDQAVSHPNNPHSPSPTHMIMLILIHGMLIDSNYCAHLFNLRIAQDTVLIRQQYEEVIDWKFIEKRFKEAHLEHIPAAYFQAIQFFLGMPSPVIYKQNWRTSLFIQRIRFNHWIGRTMPRLNKFLFPLKMRYCYEKSVIGRLIKEYWIRIQNKGRKILS